MKVKNVLSLKKKIEQKKAHVSVIGLGYVGLPLAVAFAEVGFKVTGIDLDSKKVKLIQKGESYIGDIKTVTLKKVVKAGKLAATTNFNVLSSADVVIVCVPTPLNRVRDPDVSYIVAATEEIKKRLHRNFLIILESTTYPGTTEEIIVPALEREGLKVGTDYFVCFSPERIDPGNKLYHTRNIPKVVGGVTPACGELAKALYSKITNQVIQLSSPKNAEMTKILENTFRIVNIGLINELACVADKLGVNIWEAIEAAKTKPFGFMPFYPGPGIGGHCIGVDPIYLSWKARTQGVELHFIDLARRVNTNMPRYVVSRAVLSLNQIAGKAVKKSRILILGVAYKKNVDDIRESPALEIIQELSSLGASISYHDPHVPELKEKSFGMKSLKISAGLLRKQDLVILITDHSSYDLKFIVKHSRLIFDTRNALNAFTGKHIVRL